MISATLKLLREVDASAIALFLQRSGEVSKWIQLSAFFNSHGLTFEMSVLKPIKTAAAIQKIKVFFSIRFNLLFVFVLLLLFCLFVNKKTEISKRCCIQINHLNETIFIPQLIALSTSSKHEKGPIYLHSGKSEKRLSDIRVS